MSLLLQGSQSWYASLDALPKALPQATANICNPGNKFPLDMLGVYVLSNLAQDLWTARMLIHSCIVL